MLEFVENESPTESELREWLCENLGDRHESTLDTYLRFIQQLDLIEKIGDRFQITSEGKYLLETEDADLIFVKLIDIVKGFEEILSMLKGQPLSLSEIAINLRPEFPDYKLPESVVIKHLQWLQCIGYVKQSNNEYKLTERGALAADSEIEFTEVQELSIDAGHQLGQERQDQSDLRERAKKAGTQKVSGRTVTQGTPAK